MFVELASAHFCAFKRSDLALLDFVMHNVKLCKDAGVYLADAYDERGRWHQGQRASIRSLGDDGGEDAPSQKGW